MWWIIAFAYVAVVVYAATISCGYDTAMVTCLDKTIFYLSAFATMAGLWATIRQSVITSRQLKTNILLAGNRLIADTIHDIASDKGMQELFDGIEKKKIEIMAYDPKTVVLLNRLLARFAIIANARKDNIINDDALGIILYDLLRIMNNEAVKDHIEYNLGEMKKTFPKIDEHPYKVLMEMVDRFSGDNHSAKPR